MKSRIVSPQTAEVDCIDERAAMEMVMPLVRILWPRAIRSENEASRKVNSTSWYRDEMAMERDDDFDSCVTITWGGGRPRYLNITGCGEMVQHLMRSLHGIPALWQPDTEPLNNLVGTAEDVVYAWRLKSRRWDGRLDELIDQLEEWIVGVRVEYFNESIGQHVMGTCAHAGWSFERDGRVCGRCGKIVMKEDCDG